MIGFQSVLCEAEEIQNDTVDREESLSLRSWTSQTIADTFEG